MSGRVRRSRPSDASGAAVPRSEAPAARAAAPAAPPPPPRDDLEWLVQWPARWLTQLPASWTLRCKHLPRGRVFVVTSNRQAFAAARSRSEPCLHAIDWLQLCEAAEADRAVLALAAWLVPTMPPPRPPDPPDWTLPPQPLAAELGAPLDDVPTRRLSVRDTLAHFGAVATEILDTDAAISGTPIAAAKELL